MKIRQGFVSNSSTTSFCIYGAYVNVPEVSEDSDDELVIEDLCAKHGLTYESYNGRFIVGLTPWNMKEDETYAQFKKRVSDALEKAFNVNDCGWIEEAGYDG